MGCGASSSSGVDAAGKKLAARPVNKPGVAATANTSLGGPNEGSQLQVLRQTCLEAHNKKRALHGAAPLTLSDDLNQMAQKWADYLAEKGKFEHSKGQNAGENLAAHSNLSSNSGEVITNLWYDEIKQYNFNKQGFSMSTGHFTQLVWKSTTQLGVGMARNDTMGMYVFVANYRPQGNMMGAFEQNIGRPTS